MAASPAAMNAASRPADTAHAITTLRCAAHDVNEEHSRIQVREREARDIVVRTDIVSEIIGHRT